MGKSKTETLSAAEIALVNEVTAPVQAAEAEKAPEAPPAPPAEDEVAAVEKTAVDPTNAAALNAAEEAHKTAINAEAEKILAKMQAAATKAEGQYALTWLTLGGMAAEYTTKKVEAGHGFNSACDRVKLALGGYVSYSFDTAKLIRAYSVWQSYCQTKDMNEKDQEKTARAIPWRTWYHVLATLTAAAGGKASANFTLLPFVGPAVVELIDSAVKEKFSYDDMEDKARALRATSAEKTQEETRKKAEEERKRQEEAEKAAAEARKAKEEADRAEREAAAEKKRQEEAAAEAQKKADEAAAAAAKAKEEAAGDDDGAEAEAIRAVEAEAEAAAAAAAEAKRKAQDLAEAQEKARQEKDAADKARKEAEERVKEAQRSASALEKTADAAGKTLEKIRETQERKDSGAGKDGGKDRPKDQGPNVLNAVKDMAPADVASMMFAILTHAKMPSSTFSAFVAELNKEGGKLFKDDPIARQVIGAAVLKLEELTAKK